MQLNYFDQSYKELETRDVVIILHSINMLYLQSMLKDINLNK